MAERGAGGGHPGSGPAEPQQEFQHAVILDSSVSAVVLTRRPLAPAGSGGDLGPAAWQAPLTGC
jgi:hypothetical protein